MGHITSSQVLCCGGEEGRHGVCRGQGRWHGWLTGAGRARQGRQAGTARLVAGPRTTEAARLPAGRRAGRQISHPLEHPPGSAPPSKRCGRCHQSRCRRCVEEGQRSNERSGCAPSRHRCSAAVGPSTPAIHPTALHSLAIHAGDAAPALGEPHGVPAVPLARGRAAVDAAALGALVRQAAPAPAGRRGAGGGAAAPRDPRPHLGVVRPHGVGRVHGEVMRRRTGAQGEEGERPDGPRPESWGSHGGYTDSQSSNRAQGRDKKCATKGMRPNSRNGKLDLWSRRAADRGLSF